MTHTEPTRLGRRAFVKSTTGALVLGGLAGCTGGSGASGGGGSGGGGSGGGDGGTGAATPTPEQDEWVPSATLRAAEDEGSMVAYFSISQSDLDTFYKPAFEERYSWATIDFQNFGTAEMASKLIAERRTGTISADVFSMSEGTSRTLVGQGIIRSIDADHFIYRQAEAMGHPEEFYADGFMLPGYGLPYTLLYNTDFITESEAPDTWEQLGDDKWTGRSGIVMQHPSNLSSMGGLFATLWGLWGEEKWRTVVADIMDNNPQILSSNSQSYRVMIQGERTLSPNYVNDLVLQLKQGENPPAATKWLDPSLMSSQPSNLIEGARSPNLAEVFISWWISEEAQYIIGETGTWPMHPETANGHPDLVKVIPPGTEILRQAFNEPEYNGANYLENPNAWVPLFNEAFGTP